MNALAKRLVRLEARFAPVEHDYLSDPRKRHRLTVTNIGKKLPKLNEATSNWRTPSC
jgi:hypothetical protein